MAAGAAQVTIERACESTVDPRALRAGVLEALGRVMRFDAYVWLLTDPATSVGTSPFAKVPRLPELPTLIRLKYGSSEHRWTTLDGVGVTVLGADATSDRTRQGSWAGFVAATGMGEVASVVFRDRFGCWGWLDLWRSGADGPFPAYDLDLLAAVSEPITAALRRCQAAAFGGRSPKPTASGPVVVILSPDLRVLNQTPAAEEFLRRLLPTGGDRDPIPAAAYNLGAQLLAAEAGVDASPARARVHLGGGAWVTMQAGRLSGDGDQDIAISIEPTSPADRLDLFARVHGFTPRETELLEHLASGADTRDAAAGMFVSEHTIQDHLKAVFDKTGSRSRREVLSKAVGS